MHARVTTITSDPARVDDVVKQVEGDTIAELKQIDGFKGFTLLVDRESGKGTAISFWESEEAMRASEEATQSARERAAEAGGATGAPSVERFEVAIDTTV